MAEHLWSVLCGRAVIDKYTGTLSIFDVREAITVGVPEEAPQPIIVPIPITMASLWLRSETDIGETGTARFRMVRPDGTAGPPQELEVNLDTGPRSRTLFYANAMQVGGSGTYHFTVEYKGADEPDDAWVEVARHPLVVTVETTPPQEVAID